jgi:hypothetical protein
MLTIEQLGRIAGQKGIPVNENFSSNSDYMAGYNQGLETYNKVNEYDLDELEAYKTAQNNALSLGNPFETDPTLENIVPNLMSHEDYVPDSREVQNQKQSLRSAGFSDTALWNLPDYVENSAWYVKPGQFDAKELPYNMVGLGATNYGVDLNNVTDRFQNIWETYGQYAEGVKPWSESPIPESEAKMGGNKSIWNGMKDFLGPQGGGSRDRYGPEAAAAYENYIKTGQITDAMPAGMAFDAFDYGGRYTGNKFQNKPGSIFDRFVAPALTIGATIINPYLGMATAGGIGAIQGKSPGEIALNAGQAFVGGGGLNPTTAAGRFGVTAGNTLATGLRTDFDPLSMGLTAGTTYLGNAPEITGTNIGEDTFDLQGALTDQIPDPLFPDGVPISTNLSSDNFIAPSGNPFSYVGTNAVTGFDVPNPVPGFSSVVAPTVDIPASTTSLSPTATGFYNSPDYSLPIPTTEQQLTDSLFPEGGTADTTLQNNINPFLRSDSFIPPEIPDPAVDTLFGEGQFAVNNPFATQPNYIDEFTLEPDSILDKIKDNPFEATKLALSAAGEFFPDETATATAGSSGNPFQAPKAPAVTGRQVTPYEFGFKPMQITPINYRSFFNPFS